MDAEIKELDRLATIVIAYLVIASLASFALGFLLFDTTVPFAQLLATAFIGFSGSAVAALTSCLDRYATGFELEGGKKVPAKAEGETFNRRMSRWFFVRPFLGFVVGPVFILGVVFFVKDPQPFKGSVESLAFTAFMAGLLSKSVLDLIKNLFKNVFRA